MNYEHYHPHITGFERGAIGDMPLIAEYLVLVRHYTRRANYKGEVDERPDLRGELTVVDGPDVVPNLQEVVLDDTIPGVLCFRRTWLSPCVSSGTWSTDYMRLKFFATNHANAIRHVRRHFLPGDLRPIRFLRNLTCEPTCVRYVPLDHPDVANGSLPVIGLGPDR